MAMIPMEYSGGGTATSIKSTSSTTAQSFSDKDISEYDGFVLSSGAGQNVHAVCYIPKDMINKFPIFRVPLTTTTNTIICYAEVNFSDKTLVSSNSTYYATLYGIKN